MADITVLCAYLRNVKYTAHLPAQDSSAVACIGDMQPAGMQQQDNSCGAWPGALPCRAAQPALALRPLIILR